MQSIGVLGAGTWGIALAKMLANTDKDVTVWSAIPEEISTLEKTRCHKNLEGTIPQAIRFTTSIQEVCTNKDIILFAVPSPFVRETSLKAKPFVHDNQIIVDVAKGIESSLSLIHI